jgi:carbamoyl-phosphate synthase large subunit
MIADYLLKGIEPVYEIQEKTILRYWKELVVENEEVKEMKTSRQLNQSNPTSL